MQAPSLLMQVQDLFKFSIFRVPNYQRGFAWGPRQISDLLEDLEEMEPDKTHYTGTVVLVKKEEREHLGETYSTYDIIDGQQRLTTIIILLQSLFEAYCDLGEVPIGEELAGEMASALREGYIVKGPIKKISLNKDCNDFFVNLVIKAVDIADIEKATNSSEENLRKAKDAIDTHMRTALAGATIERRIKYLNELRRKITNGLMVNRYVVDSDAEAGVIFEVMNDRGKPLSGADKIKNYLIYLAYKVENEELADTINRYWGDIFRNLMASRRASEDDFLRYHWIIYTDQQKEYDIHRRIKERITLKDDSGERRDEGELEDLITAYGADLRQASDIFVELNRPFSDSSFTDDPYSKYSRLSEIRSTVDRFHRMGTTASFFPLLISARMFFGQDPGGFLELLSLLEVFAFRVLVIGNRRANTGQSALYSLAYEIHEQRNALDSEREQVIARMKNRIARLIHDYSPEDHFEQHLASESFYGDYQSREIKYFFYELELEKAKASPEQFTVTWDGDHGVDADATIEHIWPQNPRGYDSWPEREQQIHDEYMHRLGNLTLTGCNPKLSNKPFLDSPDFEGKQALYDKSYLRVQREIGKYGTWDVPQIEERQADLITFASRRWSLPDIQEPPVLDGHVNQYLRKENLHTVLAAMKQLNNDLKEKNAFKGSFHRYQGKKEENAAVHIDLDFEGHTLSVWGDYGVDGIWVYIVPWNKNSASGAGRLYREHLTNSLGICKDYKEDDKWSLYYGDELKDVPDIDARRDAIVFWMKKVTSAIAEALGAGEQYQ